MPLVSAPDLPASFPPYEEWRRRCGLVPRIMHAQSLLPRAIEAETQLARVVLLTPGALTVAQKGAIVGTVAAQHRSEWCAGFASYAFAAEPATDGESALIDMARKLGCRRGGLRAADVAALRMAGMADEQIVDAILAVALTRFLCAVSTVLSVQPDAGAEPMKDAGAQALPEADPAWAISGPFVSAPDVEPSFDPFVRLENTFGFVPNLFRAQTLRPDALAAEASLIEAVMTESHALPRIDKEQVLLAVSAAALNTSCASLHAEVLRLLGADEDLCEQLLVDHRGAGLPPATVALLDAAVRMAGGTGDPSDGIGVMRAAGFSDAQILEAILTSALAVFLTTLQCGLATQPDFPPRRVFAASAKPDAAAEHPDDPDAQLVGRARAGEVVAFEELVRRHHRRIYRAALAVTGNEADAEDAAQVAFVKAFNALAAFERHARFTTWLTRIAINEALSRVRARRPSENLPLDDEEEGFRPTITGAWTDSPEQLYEREEMRQMIERALSDMPVKYRMAVLLRDVEQLSTIDAASALGLPVPTLKKHLLKGRLLLREALAPHFTPTRGAITGV